MFETRFGYLFGSSVAEFPSHYGLADSVAHLRAVVSASEFFLLRQAAVGTVETGRVHLRRGGPATNKAYRLRFDGAFRQKDGVCLSGRFVVEGQGEVQRIIVDSVWESFLLICLTGAFIRPPFIPLLIAGVTGGNLWRCKSDRRSMHRDIAWLSAVIKDALAG